MARGPSKKTLARVRELLGPLEADVMEVIWARDSATVAEIEAVLNGRKSEPLAYKTFLTICTRLTDKGLLRHQREGRSFRYEPTMDPRTFVTEHASRETDALLRRYGDLAVSAFADQVVDKPALLAQLRDLLESEDE